MSKFPIYVLTLPVGLAVADRAPSAVSLALGVGLFTAALLPWVQFYKEVFFLMRKSEHRCGAKRSCVMNTILFYSIVISELIAIVLAYFAYWLFSPIFDTRTLWIQNLLLYFAPVATILLIIRVDRLFSKTEHSALNKLFFWLALNSPLMACLLGEHLVKVDIFRFYLWFLGLFFGYALAVNLLRNLAKIR